jgi:hypothetical protein
VWVDGGGGAEGMHFWFQLSAPPTSPHLEDALEEIFSNKLLMKFSIFSLFQPDYQSQ